MKKMKTNYKLNVIAVLIGLLAVSCGVDSQTDEDNHNHGDEHSHEEGGHEHHDDHEPVVYFSQQQYDAFGIEVDTLSQRNMGSYVEANGQLEVPPQNEAIVTTIIGANISSIKVIEGDKVSKGQVLGFISHPDLIELQTDYVNAWSQLQYLEKDYQRQMKLYDRKVISGKEFQKAEADYKSSKGMVSGFEAQFKLLHLDIEKIKNSDIYEQIPLQSPIDGYIRLVQIKMGQFVQPQKELFEIVNIDHIHADLMVYEKDINKVNAHQKVKFTLESDENKELEAVIYSVGKAFEQEPKAIHIHAEIENKAGLLLPGMYVEGRILVDDTKVTAIHEEALVREGGKFFVFTAEKITNSGGQVFWKFEPVEVKVGRQDGTWIEIKLMNDFEPGVQIAMNNAYYLISELNKEEAEHSH